MLGCPFPASFLTFPPLCIVISAVGIQGVHFPHPDRENAIEPCCLEILEELTPVGTKAKAITEFTMALIFKGSTYITKIGCTVLDEMGHMQFLLDEMG